MGKSEKTTVFVEPEEEWDVFISYASEDRDIVAGPLANALREKGLRVWFDQFEIKVGDSLFASISEGIRLSKFGIVILSPNFFAKQWTKRELSAFFNLSTSQGKNSILPIWYKMSVAEINKFSPLLSDIVALRWEDSLEVVTSQILSVTAPERSDGVLPKALQISGQVRRYISDEDYQTILTKYFEANPLETLNALNNILTDIEQPSLVRTRTIEIFSLFNELKSINYELVLRSPSLDLLSALIRALIKGDYPLTPSQLNILMNNSSLPNRSTDNIGDMVRYFNKLGSNFTSEVFLPLTSSNHWTVKHNCVKAIIKMDDEKSMEVLSKFSTMSYWLAREKIIEYINEKTEGGKIKADEVKIAKQIINQIRTDGQTDNSKLMRLSGDALWLLEKYLESNPISLDE